MRVYSLRLTRGSHSQAECGGIGYQYRRIADGRESPLPDDQGSGDVWEFIKDVGGISPYIKLKLDPRRGCVCLSFHESTGPVTLPCRNT